LTCFKTCALEESSGSEALVWSTGLPVISTKSASSNRSSPDPHNLACRAASLSLVYIECNFDLKYGNTTYKDKPFIRKRLRFHIERFPQLLTQSIDGGLQRLFSLFFGIGGTKKI